MPTWMPNFLNATTAAIAASAVIPALLILYFLKLRRREMPISSTLLWKKAIQDLQVNAPFQKLRKNLLLILQMLLLLLLLFALARPVVNYTPGAGKISVLLIDRSASMRSTDQRSDRTRLEEAKAQAKHLVDTLDRGATAMVIAFDDSAQIVQSFTSDTVQLKKAIDAIEPTDRKSRLKQAYQLAEAQSTFIAEQNRAINRPEVYVFSDGRVLDPQDLSIRGEVRYHKIGSDNAGNVGIVALSAKRSYERPTEVQVFARMANFGPEPINTDVELLVNGERRGLASVALAPDRWNDSSWIEQNPGKKDPAFSARESVEFNIELTTSAVVQVKLIRPPGDALASDDLAQVIVPPPRSLSVLLVTDGNYFLERLMSSLNLRNPQIMRPAAYEESKPGQFDLIIFDNHKPTFLPPAGSFIHFGEVPDGLTLKPAAQQPSPAAGPIGVLDWKRDHPILRYLNLDDLWVTDPIQLELAPETEVLVESVRGPIIVLHREGRQTHLIGTFDLLPSTWPVKISFPVFVYESLQFLALGSDMNVRESLEPGATPVIPRTALQRVDPHLKQIRLIEPDGSSRALEILPEGDFALPALDEVGVYKLDPPVPQMEQIAVNLLDDNESNVVPLATAPGGVGEVVAGGQGKSRMDLWWWIIACAALPLLLVEWWVYTRRVHL